MKTQLFQTADDIADNWQLYAANEALALSRLDDFEIDNYADREILNPDVQALLSEMPDTLIADAEEVPLTLSFAEARATAFALFGSKFRRLKNKIREFLCRILAGLAGDSDLNWKDIIKAVLVALIPVLGGGLLSVVVLPILISLVAKIIKRGMDAVCPVTA